MAVTSKYAVELYNPAGKLLAELTGRATSRSLVMSRNEAESISWSVDLNEFEDYCRRLGQHPRTILMPLVTEVRIRRLGTYVGGGQLAYCYIALESGRQVIQMRATGFLNLFKKRYTGDTPAGSVQQNFTAVEATTIARTLIDQSQALTNGNYGVTIGTLAQVGPHDRTYNRTNIKDALQDLTRVQKNPFDFEFTHNKVFNTYASIGSNRPDIVFEYPGNVIGLAVPIDASDVANEILGLGQGAGEASQAQYTAVDTPSQLAYRLRQEIFMSNATDNSNNGLTDSTEAYKEAHSLPLEIPALVIDGNAAPFITDYHIGDRVLVKVSGYQMLDNINGSYRIERIELDIDESDNERITLRVSP